MRNGMVAAVLAVLAALAASASAQSAPAVDGNDILCTQWGCVGGSLTASYSSWRSIPDGDYQNNFGPAFGLDVAAPIPVLSQYGLGVQAAASYGTYDLAGRDSTPPSNPQRQQFVSLGLFRRPDPSGAWWSRWGAGAAYDVSFNHNAGTQANSYVISQVRGQASYDIAGGHEAGLWFADYSGTASSGFNEYLPKVANRYRAVDQLNFFYKYNMSHGGYLRAYVGPGIGGQSASLANNGAGRVFTETLGADAEAPLCDYASLYGGFSYGRPRLTISPYEHFASIFEENTVTAGLRFYWGGNARARADGGRRWMPYLDAPNNANFVAQSNTAN